jgi:PadR family transcriptional regulator AphA
LNVSLPHAILGFLQYRPRTGYDLKRMFDASVQHFWPAQQSHIYQALTKLGEQGYASVEHVPQVDRPGRKVYSITERGREELRQWLKEPRPERPVRAPFLIQLFFAGHLADDEILEVLEGKANELRKMLALYSEGSVSQPTFSKDLPEREQFFWYLTLDFGIGSMRFALEWIEDLIDRIGRKEYEKGMSGAFTQRSGK